MSVAGKRIAVTGAATGIGRATVIELAAQGARTALVDVNESALTDLVASVGGDATRAWRADVSRPDEIRPVLDTAVGWLGGLDAVFHAAGIMRGQAVHVNDLALETWEEVIRVNLTGSFLVAQAAARHMVPAGRGTIVLVASGGGVIGPSGSVAYGASKGGMHGLALTLAAQLAPHGIRVTDVCPGSVDTPLMRGSIEEARSVGGDTDLYRAIESRLITSESIARAMVFVISDDAAQVRGTLFMN